jgi:uncharacterized protein
VGRYDVIRDPLYGPITLDDTACRLIDTAAFQRLRRVRQLSLASVLYPSAMHTRFEHSVGVYHLAREMVRQLAGAGELEAGEVADQALIAYAGLLHDAGQHMCAHLLDEFGYPGITHEEAGAALFHGGEVGEILARSGIPDAGERIAALVQHRSEHPLAGVVAGACDADKLDYLIRDAYHCGLPAGFDQQHLRDSLCVVVNPATGRRETALEEHAVASFEHMLYSKNALFRNVYFHPTVRGAMVMLRALVVAGLEAGLLASDELHRWSDEELFTVLRVRAAGSGAGGPLALVHSLLDRLLARRLYRCAVSLPLSAAVPLRYDAVHAIEAELAARLGLAQGEALLDIPRKPTMLSTEILVRRRDGSVVHAAALTPDDGFALNEAQQALYAASGRVCVFTATPVRLEAAEVREILERRRDAARSTAE